VRKTPLASLVLVLLGGCIGLEKYTWDPTNLTVLGIFIALFAGLFFMTFFLGRPETKARQVELTRQERNWQGELEAARQGFVLAQQAVLDRAMELLPPNLKEDPELRTLRLKSHSAMAKVIKLQEEMLRGGVPEERVGSWEEI
jgi:hypothetical protein